MGKNTERYARRGGRRVFGRAFLAIVMTLGLAACDGSVTQDGGAERKESDGVIKIVTATNVYTDIARSIGAEHVEATPLISSMAQDPHSYEASVHDKLTVSGAELVIENGGGYDDFLHALAHDAGVDHGNIISAVKTVVSGADGEAEGHGDGHDHNHEEFNEHVWYSLAGMEKLSGAIAEKLSSLRPDNAATFAENNKKFTAELGKLGARMEAAKKKYDGRGVIVTEPTPLYLLEDIGFKDRTPPAFSIAVESGQEVSALVLDRTRNILKEQNVALLADTLQAETAQTKSVTDAARQGNIPVIAFSETIPDGKDYLSWMRENIDSIIQAVR